MSRHGPLVRHQAVTDGWSSVASLTISLRVSAARASVDEMSTGISRPTMKCSEDAWLFRMPSRTSCVYPGRPIVMYRESARASFHLEYFDTSSAPFKCQTTKSRSTNLRCSPCDHSWKSTSEWIHGYSAVASSQSFSRSLLDIAASPLEASFLETCESLFTVMSATHPSKIWNAVSPSGVALPVRISWASTTLCT